MLRLFHFRMCPLLFSGHVLLSEYKYIYLHNTHVRKLPLER
nr:MAG TPA: hypothetical protein [Caudoviricetes sp.]